MSRNTTMVVVVVLLLAIVGWFFLRPKQTIEAPVSSQPTQTPVSSTSASPSAATDSANMEKNVVTISSAGFTPKDTTIKVGDIIVWTNGDAANHTVNSDPHPTHTLYPILNKVGLIKVGEKKSLQFTQAGTYKYHDHLNPSLTGSVTVQ